MILNMRSSSGRLTLEGSCPCRAEYEAFVPRLERVEFGDRHVGQREDMCIVILRASDRERPDCGFQIDLHPVRLSHFPSPLHGEHEPADKWPPLPASLADCLPICNPRARGLNSLAGTILLKGLVVIVTLSGVPVESYVITTQSRLTAESRIDA